MNIITEAYSAQLMRWPATGKHILAQYDDTSIIVYQAYRPSLASFAIEHGYFGGEFSLSRMSWIKPGFLWMMYRSGWAKKPGQEVILAVRLKRSAFDQILSQAVHSTYVQEIYETVDTWKRSVAHSSVRLQWDPDHDPLGGKVERRALQLGLRSSILAHYAHDWIIKIEDISQFVHQQHSYVRTQNYHQLIIPRETIYPISDGEWRAKLGVNSTE